MFRPFVSYSILVPDVTEEELADFNNFRDTIPPIGCLQFWSGRPDWVVLWIEKASPPSDWLTKTLPALEEYWGKDRIIHNVEQVPAELVDDPPEDMPPVPHDSMSAETYIQKVEEKEQRATSARPAFKGNPAPNVPPRRRPH